MKRRRYLGKPGHRSTGPKIEKSGVSGRFGILFDGYISDRPVSTNGLTAKKQLNSKKTLVDTTDTGTLPPYIRKIMWRIRDRKGTVGPTNTLTSVYGLWYHKPGKSRNGKGKRDTQAAVENGSTVDNAANGHYTGKCTDHLTFTLQDQLVKPLPFQRKPFAPRVRFSRFIRSR